jgi:hypothetical protein
MRLPGESRENIRGGSEACRSEKSWTDAFFLLTGEIDGSDSFGRGGGEAYDASGKERSLFIEPVYAIKIVHPCKYRMNLLFSRLRMHEIYRS